MAEPREVEPTADDRGIFHDVPGTPGLSFAIGAPAVKEDDSPDLLGGVVPVGDDFGDAYAATRASSEELDTIESLEAQYGAELDAEAVEPPVEEVIPARAEGEGPGFGEIMRDIGQGILNTDLTELPLQTIGAVRDAAQETIKFVDSLGNWVASHTPEIEAVQVGDLTVFDPRGVTRFDLPEVPEARTGTLQVYRGIAQFIFGMVGAGKVTGLSKLKNLTKVQQAGKFGLQGAIADAVARDPEEENLATLFRMIPSLQKNAVLEFLEADPDNNEAEERLKKAFEGFFVGAVLDGLIVTLGLVKASRALRKAAKQAALDKSGVGQTQAEIDALAKVSRGDRRTVDDVEVSFPIRVQETGETVTATQNAGAALKAAETRISKLEAVKKCLSR